MGILFSLTSDKKPKQTEIYQQTKVQPQGGIAL
jgi:hypothetical protein